MDKDLFFDQRTERLAELMPTLETAVRRARQAGAAPAFLHEAGDLVVQFAGTPGDGAVESINDAPRDLSAAESFLARWNNSRNHPPYAAVLECVSRMAEELRRFVKQINGLSPAEIEHVKKDSLIGKSLLERRRFRRHHAIATATFVVCGVVIWAAMGFGAFGAPS